MLGMLCWGNLGEVNASKPKPPKAALSTRPTSKAPTVSKKKERTSRPTIRTASRKKPFAVKRRLREGVIVRTEQPHRFFVDLGFRNGATPGTEVRVFRRVEVRHPITKKTIKDRFFIGRGKLRQVSQFLSILEPEGKFSHPPVVGDFIVPGPAAELETRVKVVKVIKRVKVPCPQGEKSNPQEDALLQQWKAMKGKPMRARIRSWMDFLKEHPEHPSKVKLKEHIQWLLALEKRLKRPQPQQMYRFFHAPPSDLRVGEVMSLTTALVTSWQIGSVICHYRKENEQLYKQAHFRRENKFYYRVNLPIAVTEDTGTLDYFIEVLDRNGTRFRGVGSEERPIQISVAKGPELLPPAKNRSFASLYVDYVDFFLAALGKDGYLKLEVDYRHLLDLPIFYSIRMGFGIFEGQGSWSDKLEANPQTYEPIPRAFTYGYLEGEFRFHRYFAVMARGILGSVRRNELAGPPNAVGAIFGFQGRVRIGLESRTNLQLGVMATLDVGTEGLIAISISEVPKFPMLASVIVTNLPLGKELGVRLLYQIGWRPVSWFSMDARVGWNVRNINHSGPTVGLGAAFRW